MTDTLSRILRAVLFGLLAVAGMAMALIFMLSTAIAVGILYLIAKVRGKPFGAHAYWSKRRATRANPFPPGDPAALQTPPLRNDVIDVQAREIR